MKKWKIYSIIISIILIILIISLCVYTFIFKENISENEAKNIALERANVEEQNITILSINKDKEDKIYEINFYDANYEYNVDVNYNNGKVQEFEKDILNNTNNTINTNNTNTNSITNTNSTTTSSSTTSSTTNNYIGEERAKTIVLEDANLNSTDITFSKIELDIDHNTPTYEIEFYYNNFKYDYKLNAISGEILKYEKSQ